MNEEKCVKKTNANFPCTAGKPTALSEGLAGDQDCGLWSGSSAAGGAGDEESRRHRRIRL